MVRKTGSIRELVGHLLVASVLLLKGVDKLGHGHAAIGMIMIASGVIVLGFLAYSTLTGRGHRSAKSAVFLFEALAMSLVTYLYFEEGKQFIKYATLLASVMCLMAGVVMIFRRRPKEESIVRKADLSGE